MYVLAYILSLLLIVVLLLLLNLTVATVFHFHFMYIVNVNICRKKSIVGKMSLFLFCLCVFLSSMK